MPHLVLEYTANVGPPVDPGALFAQLHQALARTAAVDLAACKSRALALDVYHVGAGGPEQAFVHLEVRLLAGRLPAEKRRIAQACLEILAAYYAASLESLQLQLTVEVRDMERESYLKTTGPKAS
jgi:5-carboxymethyl-2-hydroxymuconate isomerase